MTKQQIIEKLNKTDDYKALGFISVADDGANELIRRGNILLNRWRDEEGNFEYDEDVSGWDQR